MEEKTNNFFKNILTFVILTLVVSILAIILTMNLLEVDNKKVDNEDYISPDLVLVEKKEVKIKKEEPSLKDLIEDDNSISETTISKTKEIEENRLLNLEKERILKEEERLKKFNDREELKRIKLQEEKTRLEIDRLKKERDALDHEKFVSGEGIPVNTTHSQGLKDREVYSQGEDIKSSNNYQQGVDGSTEQYLSGEEKTIETPATVYEETYSKKRKKRNIKIDSSAVVDMF